MQMSFADNDSLKIQLPDTFNYKNPAHYIKLASEYVANPAKLELARNLIEEGLKRGANEKNDFLVTMMNYYLGDYNFYKEDYRKAMGFYQKVLPSFVQMKDTLMIAKTLNSIGLAYSYQNDIENTLKYYLEEIDLLNKIKHRTRKIDTERIVVLNNIINNYRSTKQYNKVIEQATLAVTFAQELGDSVRLASILNSQATAYKNLNQIDKSLETYRKAEIIFDKLGDDFRKAFLYINIGGVYDFINKQDSSLIYYEKALKTFRAKGYIYGELNAETGIAGVYSIKNKLRDALNLYLSCVEKAKPFGFNDIILESYSAIAQLEYKLGNYFEAYNYKEQYDLLNDSIFTVEKNQQYAELQTKYETVQKENEINLLKSDKLIRENELRRNKLWNWIVVAFLIILLIFIYVGFVFYNQKRKANALLTEKNNQIEQKNFQLNQMNQQIVQINEKLQVSQVGLINANNAKNRFFSILGHDLRNPFHSIMGQSYLLSKSYLKLSADERRKYANDILNSCEQVNRLLDNLLEWIRTQSEGIVLNPRKFEFHKLVQDSLSVLKNNAIEKSIEIDNQVNEGIWVMADYPMVETVMRNLINNSIKFTPTGGKVSISAIIDNKVLRVDVGDNGVGITPDDLKKLFNVDSNVKTRGTNNERGTGLGLVICKEFIDLHAGDIWAESVLERGTVFHFSIPVIP
jgi:signal transduction histidine kinase